MARSSGVGRRGCERTAFLSCMFAWRGMADHGQPHDAAQPTEQRHTQCGLNGGRQDYPVTVKSIEDLAARKEGEREGVYRTSGDLLFPE